jgi:hypothetical protein
MPRRFPRLLCLAALLCASVAPTAHGTDRPLVEATTERPTRGAIRPPLALTNFVIGRLDKDDVELLDDCLTEYRLKPANYSRLLNTVRVRASADRDLWFVRPANNPYCGALYGAHLFRYFLVEERKSRRGGRFRFVFQSGGDEFKVYAGQRHGLNDIEATGCWAGGCRTARMAFDGRRYRPVLCTELSLTGPKDVTRRRRCGSDDWSDIQGSGLIRISATKPWSFSVGSVHPDTTAGLLPPQRAGLPGCPLATKLRSPAGRSRRCGCAAPVRGRRRRSCRRRSCRSGRRR